MQIADDDGVNAVNAEQAEHNSLMPNSVQEIPDALGTHVADIKPVSAVNDWTPDLGKPAELHFEERVLYVSGDDDLQAKWVRCASTPVAPDSGRMRAAVTELAPKTFHVIRAVSGEGEASATVFTVQFHTPEKQPFLKLEARPVGLIVAIAVLGFLAWRRWKLGKRGGL